MVSPNVEDLASTFEDIVEDRDVTGAAAIAVAGAGGGIVAQQIAGTVLPIIGQDEFPEDPLGLAASGVVKIAAAAGAGYLAIRTGGTVGLAFGLMAVGAAVVAGGDVISSLLQATEGKSGSMPVARKTNGSRRAGTRTRSSGGNSGSRQRSRRRRSTGSRRDIGHGSSPAATA